MLAKTERSSKFLRALTRRRPVADEADLAECAQQPFTPGDLRHLERSFHRWIRGPTGYG